MIQDIIKTSVTRVETKFKELFYIADDGGDILLTDEGKFIGLPTSQISFTLKYKYSTPQEWINELCSVSQSKAQKRYPFIYVNSMQVKQNPDYEDRVDIGEIVIATLSNPLWSSKERDTYSFKPILNNLYSLFVEAMKVSHDYCVIKKGVREDKYFYGKTGIYGGEANIFSDHLDAISINNLQLRIFNTYL